jgi:hypothetical protein
VGESILAGLALATCVVLAVRLLLPPREKRRFDASMREAWASIRQAAHRVRHWRSNRQAAKKAAEEAIERASRRSNGHWDGNVHHNDSFKGPKKPH